MTSLQLTTFAKSAGSVTNAAIEQKQKEIKAAEKEKENLQKQVTDLKALRKSLESQKSDLTAYVKQLDENLAAIQANIDALKQQIKDKEAQIARTEEELANARIVEEEQHDSMIRRMRMMYEKGDKQMIESLLEAQSLQEMLNRAIYIERVVEYDRGKWEEYIANREYVELCLQELDLEKQLLDETKFNVEQEEANMEELIRQKKEDIAAYDSKINKTISTIEEYDANIKQQDEEIAILEAAIIEEKKRLLANNGKVITYDGGTFCQPIATYTRISDDYGMRMHPTLKVEKFHNGVDFAAPAGTAIYAAYDGTVAAAGYSSSMGNYIMIDHGDELYTLYMHASALYVSKGDVVVKGETIAAVGTTGRSTGNHLHFGVRKDGSYVSPWTYLGK
jgi:murein DD-endopeptidase MepM/ murein hydrolase activator NlpD